jgi:hypothetical protein
MERKATIESFSKKLSSSRAATKGLSKALMQAEIKQKRANEVCATGFPFKTITFLFWVILNILVLFLGGIGGQEATGRCQVAKSAIGARE